MAELLQRPWAMMFCKGTLWSKAKVAPNLRKVWKPWPEDKIPSKVKIFFSESLTCVSMTDENGGKILAKSGAVGGRGLDLRRVLRALVGQRKGYSILEAE